MDLETVPEDRETVPDDLDTAPDDRETDPDDRETVPEVRDMLPVPRVADDDMLLLTLLLPDEDTDRLTYLIPVAVLRDTPDVLADRDTVVPVAFLDTVFLDMDDVLDPYEPVEFRDP